jgi:putative sterol carrier protein
MNTPTNLSLRQTIEGMTLTFNAEAAGGLTAVIQFNITRSTDAQGRTGDKPGNYYLTIANGTCQFHVGMADNPTLIITTPADVWLKISRGELSGQDGLMQGLYQANGDLSLLLKMNILFKSAGDVSYDAPGDQRPAGPIPLSGMAWLAIAFIPWIIYWVTFLLPSSRSLRPHKNRSTR